MSWRRLLLAVALLAAAAVPVANAVGTITCEADATGGDWLSYGSDLAGTRHQGEEDVINPGNVGRLKLAWKGSSAAMNSGQSTPVVWGRCVYVTGSKKLTAIDIADGSLIWQRNLPSGGTAQSVAVAEGRVHVSMDTGVAARAASFDARTGTLLAVSEPIEFGYRVDQLAGAMVWDGKHLMPTNGPDSDPFARPGIAVFDTTNMSTLSKRTTIPAEQLDAGYAGGGIWATPVIDPGTGYAFVGTAQPYSKQREHMYDNAILKIDLRGRPDTNPTFGGIVASYKGDPDSVLYDQPACDIAGDSVQYHPSGFSVACAQLDVDFGGSPTMFRNSSNRLVVAELQKSGNVHAIYTDTMQPAWKTMVSTLPPATGGNTSSAANDGERVYVLANPGVMHALDAGTGAILWSTPLPIGSLENHPVSVANGVVYVTVNSFHVYGLDALTGVPLWVTNGMADAGTNCSVPSGGGVAIARNTVLVNCDGVLLAYRLPS